MLGGFRSYVDDTAPFKGVWAPYPASQPRVDLLAGPRVARLELNLRRAAVEALAKNNPQLADLVRAMVPTNQGGHGGYIDMLLTDVSISHTERLDPHESHGDAHALYAMGGGISQMSLAGTLLHTLQDNWFDQFAWLWSDLVRAWRLAGRGALLILHQDTLRAHLVPSGVQLSRNANMQMAATFQMSCYVQQIEHRVDASVQPRPTSLLVAAAGTTATPQESVGKATPSYSVALSSVQNPAQASSRVATSSAGESLTEARATVMHARFLGALEGGAEWN